MASKVRFEFDSKGFREILHYQEVKELVDDTGRRLAADAGEGYEYKSAELGYGGGRVGGFVYTNDYAAMVDNAVNKTLERVISR